MLRPSSLSSLLATVVGAGDGGSSGSKSSFQPHTAILALPESAEVYAFSTTFSRSPAGVSDLASLSISDALDKGEGSSSGWSASSSEESTGGVTWLTKGLMVEHFTGGLAQEDASLPSPLENLQGEERIQALAAVATMAWREDMERIHAFQRQAGRVSRSASGSTAAGSSSGRGGRTRAGTLKGKERGSETGREPGAEGATGSGQGGSRRCSKGPTVAVPGTRIIQAGGKDEAEGAAGLVPLLLDCELGPILVMPLVAGPQSPSSTASRKSGPGSSKGAPPVSPPSPPSPDIDIETPASPAMLLVLNCNPLPAFATKADATLASTASPPAPGVLDPVLNIETPTTPRPGSPAGGFRRLMMRTPSSQATQPAPTVDSADSASSDLAPGSPPSSSSSITTQGLKSGAGDRQLDETKLWTSLYGSAKAVARVIAPALAACGPALRAISGSSGI